MNHHDTKSRVKNLNITNFCKFKFYVSTVKYYLYENLLLIIFISRDY